MTTITNDEKFISIEYQTWKNKYLPLEEEVLRLKSELEREKDNKKITILLDYNYINPRYFGYSSHLPTRCIAYLRPRCSNDTLIELHHNEIDRIISDLCHMSSEFMTKEEVDQSLIDLKTAENTIDSKQADLERLIIENESKFLKIPRIIKWMFRIRV